MKILLNKDSMDELYQCVEENIDLMGTAIHMHIFDDSLINFFEYKLNAILYCMKRAYNLELIELKKSARLHYQKWISLKNSEPVTANAVYLEYLQIKSKIEEIEIPF